MVRIWTVANQKGGVGKTTTSIALAGIAAEHKQRVLVVDLDPHGSMTSYLKVPQDQLEHSVYNLFAKKTELSRTLVLSTIYQTDYNRIDVIPAVTALATLERQGIGDGMGLVLQRVFKLIEDEYDVVVLDCPPQLGVVMINALAACKQLVIPVQTEFLAIKGLERILNTLTMLYRSTHKNIAYTIVPTMFDRRTQAAVTSLRTIRNDYGDPVWPAKIPIDTRFRDASKAGVPPHLFDPGSRGVAAYRSLYQYLLNKDEAQQSSETNQGGPGDAKKAV